MFNMTDRILFPTTVREISSPAVNVEKWDCRSILSISLTSQFDFTWILAGGIRFDPFGGRYDKNKRVTTEASWNCERVIVNYSGLISGVPIKEITSNGITSESAEIMVINDP